MTAATPFRVAAIQTVTGTSLDDNLARADALIEPDAYYQ